MNMYDVYHITRTKGEQKPFFKIGNVVQAHNVFDALERHRKFCEAQNLETAGGLVTHRIVGGVGQPVQKGQPCL